MEGRKSYDQPMFIYKRMEEIMPEDHFLRKVDKVINFGFVRGLVKDLYSEDKGRPSIDPIVAVKIWLIGYFYGISSERRLMEDIQVNIAYRWFIGYNLEEEIPDHSSLTRIRDRFGEEKFQAIFDEIIRQSREKGLVSGDHLNVDATLVRADASIESMQPIKEFAKDVFTNNPSEENKTDKKRERKMSNKTHRSTTDPDATLMKKHPRTQAHLSYQCHMTVDTKNRFITGVKTLTGATSECPYLPGIIREQKDRYGFKVKDVTADKAYSSTENYGVLDELGIKAYIPVGRKRDPGKRRGYGPEKFKYDRKKHVVICPAGKVLKPQPKQDHKYSLLFISRCGDCKVCPLQKECGTHKLGHKRIMVNVLQYLKEEAEKRCRTKYGRKRSVDRRTTVETVFGQAKTQHGLARARFRGIKKVGIQFLMTATAINIKRVVTCLQTSFSYFFSLGNCVIICIYGFILTRAKKTLACHFIGVPSRNTLHLA